MDQDAAAAGVADRGLSKASVGGPQDLVLVGDDDSDSLSFEGNLDAAPGDACGSEASRRSLVGIGRSGANLSVQEPAAEEPTTEFHEEARRRAVAAESFVPNLMATMRNRMQEAAGMGDVAVALIQRGDKDGSGKLGPVEFAAFVREVLHVPESDISDAGLKILFGVMDHDHSDGVEFGELLLFLGFDEETEEESDDDADDKELVRRKTTIKAGQSKRQAWKKWRTRFRALCEGGGIEFHNFFERVDKAGAGKIHYQQVLNAFRKKLKIPAAVLSDDVISYMFCVVDADSSGYIEFDEFENFVRGPLVEDEASPKDGIRGESKHPAMQGVDIKVADKIYARLVAAKSVPGQTFASVIQKMDKDHSGQLEFNEVQKGMRKVLRIPPSELSDAQIQKFCEMLDEDKSGTVDILELIDFVEATHLRKKHDKEQAELAKQELAASSTKTTHVGKQGPQQAKPLSPEVLDTVKQKLRAVAVDSAAKIRDAVMKMDQDGSGELKEEEVRQVCRTILKIPPQELKNDQIASLCATLDHNQSNTVCIDELLEFLGVGTGNQERRKAVTKTPSINRKLLIIESAEQESIKARLKAAAYGRNKSDWQDLFKQFDKDGSGQIDEIELRRGVRVILRLSAEDVPDRHICSIFRSIDKDLSGQVDIDELIAFVNKPPAKPKSRNAAALGGRFTLAEQLMDLDRARLKPGEQDGDEVDADKPGDDEKNDRGSRASKKPDPVIESPLQMEPRSKEELDLMSVALEPGIVSGRFLLPAPNKGRRIFDFKTWEELHPPQRATVGHDLAADLDFSDDEGAVIPKTIQQQRKLASGGGSYKRPIDSATDEREDEGLENEGRTTASEGTAHDLDLLKPLTQKVLSKSTFSDRTLTIDTPAHEEKGKFFDDVEHVNYAALLSNARRAVLIPGLTFIPFVEPDPSFVRFPRIVVEAIGKVQRAELAAAREFYRREVERFPMHYAGVANLGCCEAMLGQPIAAKLLLERAVMQNPNKANAHLNLVMCLLHIPNHVAAASALERAVACSKDLTAEQESLLHRCQASLRLREKNWTPAAAAAVMATNGKDLPIEERDMYSFYKRAGGHPGGSAKAAAGWLHGKKEAKHLKDMRQELLKLTSPVCDLEDKPLWWGRRHNYVDDCAGPKGDGDEDNRWTSLMPAQLTVLRRELRVRQGASPRRAVDDDKTRAHRAYEAIKTLAFFRRLQRDQALAFLECSELLDYGSDEYVFRQGAPSDYMYVVVSGTVRVEGISKECGPFPVCLCTLYDGQLFGERPVTADHDADTPRRRASVVTQEPTTLLRFKPSDHRRIMGVEDLAAPNAEYTTSNDRAPDGDLGDHAGMSLQEDAPDDAEEPLSQTAGLHGGMVVRRIVGLKRAPFFSHTNERHLELLAVSIQEYELRLGDVILEAGTVPTGCYIIAEGTCRMFLPLMPPSMESQASGSNAGVRSEDPAESWAAFKPRPPAPKSAMKVDGPKCTMKGDGPTRPGTAKIRRPGAGRRFVRAETPTGTAQASPEGPRKPGTPRPGAPWARTLRAPPLPPCRGVEQGPEIDFGAMHAGQAFGLANIVDPREDQGDEVPHESAVTVRVYSAVARILVLQRRDLLYLPERVADVCKKKCETIEDPVRPDVDRVVESRERHGLWASEKRHALHHVQRLVA